MAAAVETFLLRANLPRSCFSISGAPLSMYHSAHLSGDPTTAAHRARTLLDSIRLDNGQYHAEYIPTPDGT